MIECPVCHFPVADEAIVCPICRAPLLAYGSIVAYIHGLSEPVNGAIACYGILAYSNNKIVFTESKVIGMGYNHFQAYYIALICFLKFFKKISSKITVKSDNRVFIDQLTGKTSVKSPNIINYYREVEELAKNIEIAYEWIPGEENPARKYSWRAYYSYCENNKTRVLETYRKYLITEKQLKLIKTLAKKLDEQIEVNEFTSRREASKIIKRLLKKINKIKLIRFV